MKPATVNERNGRVWLRMHCDIHSPDVETLVSKDAAFFRRMLQFTEAADREVRSGASVVQIDDAEEKGDAPKAASSAGGGGGSGARSEIKFVESKAAASSAEGKEKQLSFDPHAMIPGTRMRFCSVACLPDTLPLLGAVCLISSFTPLVLPCRC